MSIREITSQYGSPFRNNNGEILHEAFLIDILGSPMVLEGYRDDRNIWSEIKLKAPREQVYSIRKTPLDGENIENPFGDNIVLLPSEMRREEFKIGPGRVYSGDQLSFVEYLHMVLNEGRLPTEAEANERGFNPTTAAIYAGNLDDMVH